MNKRPTIRQVFGALVFDIPRAVMASGSSNKQQNRLPWVFMRNRNEILLPSPDGPGVKCQWKWTSELYLPKLFPVYGRLLYRRVLKDFPINLKDNPLPGSLDTPQASFIIGHRGEERLPLLLTTLKSIAAQKGCHFECIVVEQDNKKLVKGKLPDWVRYIHTPLPKDDMPYSRSWAFNVGAQAAGTDLLIFHDNDMLVPEVYAKELLNTHAQGFEFINLKRFIFYHDKSSSEKITQTENFDEKPNIEAVVQNLEAGGSFGADRQAYLDIGGFDESFVGWGGEDNEFWERANTRKVYPYGYLPIVHLWHEAQPEKHKTDAPGHLQYRMLKNTPPEKRIEELHLSR